MNIDSKKRKDSREEAGKVTTKKSENTRNGEKTV